MNSSKPDRLTRCGPLFSVVIPTYKRTAFLKRAVRSILEQSMDDWELIVSDNESPAGETWSYLEELAQTDRRITVLQNQGEKTPTENTNNAIAAASGEWVKVLHDDDMLRPYCLEVLKEAVELHPGAVIGTCRSRTKMADGTYATDCPRGRPDLEIIPKKDLLMGMFLLDDVGPATPSHSIVRRDTLLHHNITNKCYPEVIHSFDALWFSEIYPHGDGLVINRVLIERDIGKHSFTNQVDPTQIDREIKYLYGEVWKNLDKERSPLTLEARLGSIDLIRGFEALRHRDFKRAFGLISQRKGFGAWMETLRWLRRKINPSYRSRHVSRTYATLTNPKGKCA